SIQEAEVTIECAGARATRTIKNVQKYPNFESSPTEADTYALLLNLPNDDKFWPHLSIRCVQHRLFGMKEIAGNLVVTNLQKYLEKSIHRSTPNDQAAADAVNELSKRIPYNFTRVRRSIIDAYEASLTPQNESLGKTKLVKFESNAGRDRDDGDSQASIIHADSLGQRKKENDESGRKSDKEEEDGLRESDLTSESPSNRKHGNESLTTLEKIKINDMEKTAGWWHKYYASKAKLKLMRRCAIDMDESLKDRYDAYAG
ncbi:unnamed protein product, partial [Rotaria sordida]